MDAFKRFKANSIKINRAKDVFTPSLPIQNPEHLKGRDDEVDRILNTITSKGRHGLIFGDRGIGKSSLAIASLNGAMDNKIYNGSIIKVQCGTESTFEKIIKKALGEVSDHYSASRTEETIKRSVGASALKILSADFNSEIKVITEKEHIDPQTAADAIKDLDYILLIDEFDTASDDVKKSVAEMIKQLSDNDSKIKVIIVGISNDAASLIAHHPSVNRCLDEIKLERVSVSHLGEIIENGEKYLGIQFENSVKEEIIEISNGFPYFTHLLGLHCSEIVLSNDDKKVTSVTLKNAISNATKSAEGNLINNYDLAVTSSRNKNYPEILLAAANIKKNTFTIKEWIDQIEKETGKLYSSQSMSNFIGRLSREDKGGIIEKVSRGAIRIKDPRMSSFILMMKSI